MQRNPSAEEGKALKNKFFGSIVCTFEPDFLPDLSNFQQNTLCPKPSEVVIYCLSCGKFWPERCLALARWRHLAAIFRMRPSVAAAATSCEWPTLDECTIKREKWAQPAVRAGITNGCTCPWRLRISVCNSFRPHPQYGWDFPEEIPEKLRKDTGNDLRAFPGIPVKSTAGIPQTL